MSSWLFAGISLNELLFRMERFHERLQVSLADTVSALGRQLSNVKNHPLVAQSPTFHHLKESLRHILHILKEAIRASPMARKCQENASLALQAIIRRALPIWTELSRNSFLAGTTGLALGYLLARTWLVVPERGPVGYCPMKPKAMRGLVRRWCSTSRGVEGKRSLEEHALAISDELTTPRITDPRQVLIRVTALSLSPSDVLSRQASGNFDSAWRDVVGTVEEVGHRVAHLDLGDRVWTVLARSPTILAPAYVVLDGSQVFPAPSSLNTLSACSLPVAGLEALDCLTQAGGFQHPGTNAAHHEGQSVWVDDATSSVGGVALQLLQAWGIGRVVTCVPYRAVPLVKGLGADFVIPYMPDHLDTEEHCAAELLGESPFDLVVRTSNLLSEDFCRRYIKAAGGFVVSSGHKVRLNNSFLSTLLWPFQVFSRARKQDLEHSALIQMRQMVDEDLLRPTFYSVFDVLEMEEVIQYLQDERTIGKCILDVAKLSSKSKLDESET
eukprot:maker-scaffold34_size539781-snap-gene-0.15 protein:Tk05347 transcript:maker-scaffold34_size539781-snap-gene-0.15-mRNA-1 annotation:"zn-dependent oxidoreductase"